MDAAHEPTDRAALDVVVLVGGGSRRLGRDKSTVDVGGRRQVDRVLGLLAPLGGRVVVAGGAAPEVRELRRGSDVVHVEDRVGMAGPLAGVVAGLEAAGSLLVALVAVDLVAPSVDLLRGLAGEVERTGAAGAVPVVDGRWQHLHAVVRRSIGPELARGGHVAVGAALAAAGVVAVAEDRWRRWAPAATPAVDIDTPDDLARARRALRDGAITDPPVPGGGGPTLRR